MSPEAPVGAEAERWLKGLLEHPHALLLSLDPAGKVQWVSPQVKSILGHDPDRLVGQDAFAALEAPANARGHWGDKQVGTADRATYEAKTRHRDGRVVWLEVTSQAVRDDQGRLQAVHVMAIDVTERRRAQDALERSRRRFEDLLEEASDVVYLHDLEGRFLSINAAGVRLFGYSQEELMRMSVRDVVDPAHVSRAAEQMRLKLEGRSRRSLPYELLARTKSGRPVWIEVSSSAVLADGKPVAVQGIARNINERKANELALRLVQKVSFASSEAPTFQDALGTALEGLVEVTGCARAEAWVPGADGRFRLEASWPEDRALQAEKFHRLSLKASFGRGEGLVDRLRTGAPLWVPDLNHEPAFVRSVAATTAGLRGCLFVPVLAESGLQAAILLFTDTASETPPPWQALVESVASQLGSTLRLRSSHDRLERQAHLLALQVELAPVGVLLVGADGSILGANRRFLELCGVTASVSIEPMDGSFLQRVPDAASFLAKARVLYEANRGVADELQLGERFLRRFVVDLPDRSGAPLAIAVYLRDVTEMRRIESDLKARKELAAGGPR